MHQNWVISSWLTEDSTESTIKVNYFVIYNVISSKLLKNPSFSLAIPNDIFGSFTKSNLKRPNQ